MFWIFVDLIALGLLVLGALSTTNETSVTNIWFNGIAFGAWSMELIHDLANALKKHIENKASSSSGGYGGCL